MEEKYTVVAIVALIIYTLVVAFIGFRNRKSKNSEDYFLASRSLPAWLLAITFIASWWGGGSAIDLVDHAYTDGLSSFWIYGVPVLIATFLMYIFAGGIRSIGTISQSELMERRYDKRSAFMLTLFIVIFMTIGAAIQVIVVGHFLQAFLGIDYLWGAIIGTGMVIFYSSFGGFRGVVLTDLLQFVFFLASSILLFTLAYQNSGGFGALQAYVTHNNMEGYTSFTHNLSDKLAFIITFGTSWMVQANVWQRISAAKTPADARKMMAISFFVFIPLYLLVTLTGMLTLLSFDVIPEGGIVSNMLLQFSNPFIAGVIFLGLCSALMSTMDSMFNTGALTLTIDLYKRYMAPNKSAQTYVWVGRGATLLIAAMALFIGVKIQSVLTISWIGADFIATGAFVPLVLGFLWKRGTATAAFVTMIFGLLFSSYNLAHSLGAPLPVAWEIASTEQAILGMSIALGLYIIISLITKNNREKAECFINETQIIKKNKI